MPLRRGDSRIEVASNVGFARGQTIRVGIGIYAEENRVAALGSLITDDPIRGDHPAGVPVVVIGEGQHPTAEPQRPIGGRTAARVEDEDEDDDDGMQQKAVLCPVLPEYRSEQRQYHLSLLEAVLAVSRRKHKKELEFLDTALTTKPDDEVLSERNTQKCLVKFDRSLRVSLEKSCKNNHLLAEDIRQKKLRLSTMGEMMSSTPLSRRP